MRPDPMKDLVLQFAKDTPALIVADAVEEAGDTKSANMIRVAGIVNNDLAYWFREETLTIEIYLFDAIVRMISNVIFDGSYGQGKRFILRRLIRYTKRLMGTVLSQSRPIETDRIYLNYPEEFEREYVPKEED